MGLAFCSDLTTDQPQVLVLTDRLGQIERCSLVRQDSLALAPGTVEPDHVSRHRAAVDSPASFFRLVLEGSNKLDTEPSVVGGVTQMIVRGAPPSD
jgi:hypothetical protein